MNKKDEIKKLKIEKDKYEGIIFNIEMQDRLSSEDWDYIKKFRSKIRYLEKEIERKEKEN